MKRLSVYCARPISGCSANDVIEYYERIRTRLEVAGMDVIHPMTAKGYLRNDPKLRAHGMGPWYGAAGFY
jgi:hypothetical protein